MTCPSRLAAAITSSHSFAVCASLLARQASLASSIANATVPSIGDWSLPVNGDDVVAVVEDQGVDQPAEMTLEVLGVLQAGEIVLARLHDEGRRLDVGQFLF